MLCADGGCVGVLLGGVVGAIDAIINGVIDGAAAGHIVPSVVAYEGVIVGLVLVGSDGCAGASDGAILGGNVKVSVGVVGDVDGAILGGDVGAFDDDIVSNVGSCVSVVVGA